MIVFSSESPASRGKSIDDLLAVALEWLTGSPHYPWHAPEEFHPLPTNDIKEFERDGQTVWLAMLFEDRRSLGGLRLQWIENRERQWTMEIVGLEENQELLISVRLSCEFFAPGKRLPTPKKPYIIRQIFEKLGGGLDGPFEVQDEPHYLLENQLSLATEIIRGRCASRIPIVYVSVDFNGYPFIDVQQTAIQLSGIAHVIVEPSRSFSTHLARETASKNPYGGTVAIVWPQSNGRQSRLKPSDFNDASDLTQELRKRIRDAWTTRTTHVATWATLRERISHRKFDELRKAGNENLEEYIAVFDADIRAKGDELRQAQNIIQSLQEEIQQLQARENSDSRILPNPGEEQEFYPGEIADIVIASLTDHLSNTTPGSRRNIVLQDLLKQNRLSDQPAKLKEEIKRCLATKAKITNQDLKKLENLGFEISSVGAHHKIRFAGDPRFTFTLHRTASDHRAGENIASDINKKLFKP